MQCRSEKDSSSLQHCFSRPFRPFKTLWYSLNLRVEKSSAALKNCPLQICIAALHFFFEPFPYISIFRIAHPYPRITRRGCYDLGTLDFVNRARDDALQYSSDKLVPIAVCWENYNNCVQILYGVKINSVDTLFNSKSVACKAC